MSLGDKRHSSSRKEAPWEEAEAVGMECRGEIGYGLRAAGQGFTVVENEPINKRRGWQAIPKRVRPGLEKRSVPRHGSSEAHDWPGSLPAWPFETPPHNVPWPKIVTWPSSIATA